MCVYMRARTRVCAVGATDHRCLLSVHSFGRRKKKTRGTEDPVDGKAEESTSVDPAPLVAEAQKLRSEACVCALCHDQLGHLAIEENR